MTVNPFGASLGGSAAASPLVESGRRISDELNRKPQKPMALSPQAAEALEELHADYIGELGQESVRLARRTGLSTVDESHVRQAAEKIGGPGARNSGIVATANTLGGVVAGGGIASAYNLFFGSGVIDTPEIAIAIILCVVGFVLLAVGGTMALVRRS